MLDEIITPRNKVRVVSATSGEQFVWFLLWLVEIALFFRFVLKFVGANLAAPFTNFIYALSAPLVRPFAGAIPGTPVSGGIFEWSTVLALAAYWVLAWLIIMLVTVSRPVWVVHAAEQDDDIIIRR